MYKFLHSRSPPRDTACPSPQRCNPNASCTAARKLAPSQNQSILNLAPLVPQGLYHWWRMEYPPQVLRIIEPCLSKVHIQHCVVGVPCENSLSEVVVVVVHKLAGRGGCAPDIILQLREVLAVVLGVVPGVAHDVLVDIQQPDQPAVAAALGGAVGEHLHPLTLGGIGMLLLVVSRGEHHQVVALKAVVVDDEIAVIHLSGVGRLGVVHPRKQAVVGVCVLVTLASLSSTQIDKKLSALLYHKSEALWYNLSSTSSAGGDSMV